MNWKKAMYKRQHPVVIPTNGIQYKVKTPNGEVVVDEATFRQLKLIEADAQNALKAQEKSHEVLQEAIELVETP